MTICFCVAQANAQSMENKGQTLFDWCISDQRSPAYFHCIILIKGFIAGHVAARNTKFCLPRDLQPIELAAGFVQKWRSLARDNPRGLAIIKEGDDVSVALALVLERAYPCQPVNK
jgi:hypothetical protein